MTRGLLLVLALAACNPVPGPVVPVSPDADAAPVPIGDAVPEGAPMTPCVAACAQLAAIGCQTGASPNCVRVLAHMEISAAHIKAWNGRPVTCMDVALASTAAEEDDLGACQ